MNGEYIDHREYDLTPNDVQRVLDETDWDSYYVWWEEKELPVGLQLVTLHMFPTAKDYVEFLCEEHGLEDRSPEGLLKMAVTVDSMIH